jgi:hypothetical protein
MRFEIVRRAKAQNLGELDDATGLESATLDQSGATA